MTKRSCTLGVHVNPDRVVILRRFGRRSGSRFVTAGPAHGIEMRLVRGAERRCDLAHRIIVVVLEERERPQAQVERDPTRLLRAGVIVDPGIVATIDAADLELRRDGCGQIGPEPIGADRIIGVPSASPVAALPPIRSSGSTTSTGGAAGAGRAMPPVRLG